MSGYESGLIDGGSFPKLDGDTRPRRPTAALQQQVWRLTGELQAVTARRWGVYSLAEKVKDIADSLQNSLGRTGNRP